MCEEFNGEVVYTQCIVKIEIALKFRPNYEESQQEFGHAVNLHPVFQALERCDKRFFFF